MSSTEESECAVNGQAETDSDIEMVDEVPPQPEKLTPEQVAEQADEKKNEGNAQYKQQNYDAALKLYTQAIDMCPGCAAYYGNRAATYMMLTRYDCALEDARTAVQIDPSFVKGHLREAKCHLAMGEAAAAVCSYERVLQLDPSNTTATNELKQANTVQQFQAAADDSYSKGDYRKVVYCMDRCIAICTECKKFKIQKADCLAMLKRYQEAQEIANDVLRSDSTNADAVFVRGLCLYYQDNVEKAFQHFQQTLRLAPDHSKARDAYRRAKVLKQKKEEGNEAFRRGRLQDAHTLYSAALEIDPQNVFTNSKLYNNRATVLSKLNRTEEAIADCTEAIKLDDTYLKAYMRRAKCYMDSEQYEEAVRDYEKIYKMDKSRENKRLLSEAKLELKKSQRKDYYKVLGISKQATEDEIKKAYRKRALIHHPDRHSSATEEVKKEEEKKFKELGEAYSVLSDAKKRARYDSGQDLEDLGGFGEFDPNSIFQTFFGAPGGGGFSFQSGGFGGGGGHGGGFPGGFSFQFG